MADNHLPDYIIISIIIIVIIIIIIIHFNAVTKQFPKQEINNTFCQSLSKNSAEKEKVVFCAYQITPDS